MRSAIRVEPLMARSSSPSDSGPSSPAPSCSRISDRDSDRDVSGVFRSWLTWPANEASRSLERSSSAWTAWISIRLSASSRLRSRSSKTSTTRSASVARAASWPSVSSRGSSSKTHRVPTGTPSRLTSGCAA